MKFTSLFEKESRRKIGDLCLNIGATALLNIVIQFALYPYLQHKLGDNTYGVTLALLSLVAITSGPCGNAANYSRLVSEKNLWKCGKLFSFSKRKKSSSFEWRLQFIFAVQRITLRCCWSFLLMVDTNHNVSFCVSFYHSFDLYYISQLFWCWI